MSVDPNSIHAVVVTYSNESLIDDMVAGFERAGLTKVIVVDNASPDRTAHQLEPHKILSSVPITLVASPTNVGFGAGCNLGVRQIDRARELVLILNPDAQIDREQLKVLASYLRAHPACAIAVPRLVGSEGPISSAGQIVTFKTELRFILPGRLARLFRDRRHSPDFSEAGPVGAVEGACMLVRRAAFDGVGGFDEAFFLFFEESDLSRRLRGQGWTVDLCPDAWASHTVGASRDTTEFSGREHYFASTIRYLKKWNGPHAARNFAAIARICWAWHVMRGHLSRERAQAYNSAVRQVLREPSTR